MSRSIHIISSKNDSFTTIECYFQDFRLSNSLFTNIYHVLELTRIKMTYS